MRKFLLFAAVAAMTMSAGAQTLTQNWIVTGLPTGNVIRQGVGVGEKIYVNNASTLTVDVYGSTGYEKSYSTGYGWNICSDDAGNVIARAGKPGAGSAVTTDSIEVNIITPSGTIIPVSFAGLSFTSARSDYFGHAYGDLTDSGYLLLALNNDTQIYAIAFSKGAVDTDNSFYLPVSGDALSTFGTQATAGFSYVDDDGAQHATLSVRNSGMFNDITLSMANGELSDVGATNSNITLARGNNAGGEIFKLNGKLYAVVPMQAVDGISYLDGFNVFDLSTSEIVASQANIRTAQANAGLGNWTTVEAINETSVRISQTYVNDYVAQYTFSVDPTSAINDIAVDKVKTYKTIENGQVVIVKGDAKYNVMGQAIK